MRKTREVAIVVHRGNEFLMARRSRDHHWNVIAGQVEDDETFAAGARRELMEEAQLDAPVFDLELAQTYEVESQFRHLYRPGDDRVTVATFAAAAASGWEPTLNHEHDDYRWCSLEDAVALAHWPETRAGLRAAAARLRVS